MKFAATLAQLEPALHDKAKNVEKIRKAVADSESELFLAGELFLSGYMARDAFPRLAEPIDGPTIQALLRVAAEHGTHIVLGMPEREPDTKRLFNTSVMITPDGRVASYRKVYLANFGPFEEGLYFGRGEGLTLVSTKLGKVGLLICYDSFFPELAKAYALRGADILAIISASPATSKPMFDKVLPARAIESGLFVLYANLVGTELNIVFQGGTQAIGPRGEDLGRATDFKEERVRVEVDSADVKTARGFRPTLRDTRPEFWEPMAPQLAIREV